MSSKSRKGSASVDSRLTRGGRESPLTSRSRARTASVDDNAADGPVFHSREMLGDLVALSDDESDGANEPIDAEQISYVTDAADIYAPARNDVSKAPSMAFVNIATAKDASVEMSAIEPHINLAKEKSVRFQTDGKSYDEKGEIRPRGDTVGDFLTEETLMRCRRVSSKRHRKARNVQRWILLPETRPQQVWSVTLLILLFYVAVMMPLRLAFAPDEKPYLIDLVVEVLFVVDIGLSFITAYETRHGRLETDQKRIAMNYLRTWFIIDVLSVFPFWAFSSSSSDSFQTLRLPRMFKMLKLARLLKLMRFYRLRSLLVAVEYSPYVHQKLIRGFELFFVVVFFAHCSACLWFFLGNLERDSGRSWIVRYTAAENDLFDVQSAQYQYLVSLYWALTTLTTVGYGEINAQTTLELIFAMLSMVIGTTVFAYVTATVASMISDRDQRAKILQHKMSRLRSFAGHHNLSTKLRRQLTKRMTGIWTQHSNQDGSMAELMPEFPADLALRITEEIHEELMTTSAFGNAFEDNVDFMLSLFQQLLPLKLARGETLAHAGEDVHHWYIIESGELRAVDPQHPSLVQFEAYKHGDTLGDIGIFLEHGTWPTTIRCVANCKVWMTSHASLMRTVAHFGLHDRFLKRAETQLEHLNEARAQKAKALELLETQGQNLKADRALTLPIRLNSSLPHLPRLTSSLRVPSHQSEFGLDKPFQRTEGSYRMSSHDLTAGSIAELKTMILQIQHQIGRLSSKHDSIRPSTESLPFSDDQKDAARTLLPPKLRKMALRKSQSEPRLVAAFDTPKSSRRTSGS